MFLLHLGGKIRIENKVPVNTRDALSMAYTPGVARVCTAIAEDPRKAATLTIKHNSVAVVALPLGARWPRRRLELPAEFSMLHWPP